MKKRSAVIFDCDGVMFDSRKANINYYNHILRHFGLPDMSQDKIDFVCMNTAEESVRMLFKGTSYLEKAQEYRMVIDYRQFIDDMIIEPGLKELLKDLKPDHGLAVATNRTNTIDKVLKMNGLESFFDIVISSLDVKNPKPHPESLMKIADFFGISPLDSFYVGDSIIDEQAARSAGVIFISYKNRDLDADYHVNSMAEIGRLMNHP
ncbi:MAG: HAD family hydrolase [Deltaproteobacteria bacterium]|nr:HAD family hydrolase [Deltaproteobacteria bacterium]